MNLEDENKRLMARRAKIEASGQLNRFGDTKPVLEAKEEAKADDKVEAKVDSKPSSVVRAPKPVDYLTPEERADEKLSRLRSELICRQVPEEYLDCRRETWSENWKGHPTPWDERLGQWTGSPWSVTLMGEPGLGKTHLAVATMIEFWRRDSRFQKRGRKNPRSLFISVPSAIREIRAAYSAKDGRKIWSRDPADFYGWVSREWGMVIFDDVGAQPAQDNWIKEVSGWIYDRHAARLPTIVTINPGDYQGIEERASRRLKDGIVVRVTDS